MRLARLVLLTMVGVAPLPAVAADVGGSADHPIVSRYAGSEITRYQQDEFNEYGLLVGPADQRDGKAGNVKSVKPLEGKVTRILYQAPAGRSTLEVYRNYEAELNKAGFKILYHCALDACGKAFHYTVVNTTPMVGIETEQRYLAAQLTRVEGDVYVSLYLNQNTAAGQPSRTQLDVVELKPMQTQMVTVDADAMAKGLGAEGHIAIYGIYFDTDKAVLKPESKLTLEEIAKLLEAQAGLKLLVVGHTDNQGGFEHNMDLSRRRAQAVVEALSGQHGVAASRLAGHGVGYLAPVASNRNEAGRGKNRRVDLVEQ